MKEDKRPSWPHKIPEHAARWLYHTHVVSITHHRRMTGVDTSEEWVEFHRKDGKNLRVPTRFEVVWPEIKFSPYHAGLIEFSQYPDAQKTIDIIDAWEKTNSRELAEFKRLKEKFEA